MIIIHEGNKIILTKWKRTDNFKKTEKDKKTFC